MPHKRKAAREGSLSFDVNIINVLYSQAGKLMVAGAVIFTR